MSLFQVTGFYAYFAVCPPGEHGTNCSYRCPYPLYGLLCLEYCKCSRELCDYVYGCRGSTTGRVFFVELFI